MFKNHTSTTKLVALDRIHFTQSEVSPHFSCGRAISDADPHQLPMITVTRLLQQPNGMPADSFVSVDNRRLLVLKNSYPGDHKIKVIVEPFARVLAGIERKVGNDSTTIISGEQLLLSEKKMDPNFRPEIKQQEGRHTAHTLYQKKAVFDLPNFRG